MLSQTVQQTQKVCRLVCAFLHTEGSDSLGRHLHGRVSGGAEEPVKVRVPGDTYSRTHSLFKPISIKTDGATDLELPSK